MALTEFDQNSRFEKSLGLLTTRFVNLLQDADDGVLDLKVVSVSYLEKIPIKIVFLLTGCRPIKCETKTTNIRYHQCTGGDWSH